MTKPPNEISPRIASVLRGGGATPVAGVHDAVSALLARAAGFDALWVSGFGVSAALGLVDEGIIAVPELVGAARLIRGASGRPVIVDADTGLGGNENLARLVRDCAEHGIEAICVEDQAAPKRNSFARGHVGLVPAETFSEKVATAVASARCAGFPRVAVIARTEALVQGLGAADAAARCRCYADAGADAVIVQTVSSDVTPLAEFASAWHGNAGVGVIPTSLGHVPGEHFESVGFDFVIYANQALRASIRAMQETFVHLVGGNHGDLSATLPTMDDILQLQRPWKEVQSYPWRRS